MKDREFHKSEICAWLATGNSLAAYCREKSVGYATVTTWLREDENFQANYARAREDSADADADIISDIRDRVLAGLIEPDAARVAIDACKWTAGRRKPKKYGEKISLDVADVTEREPISALKERLRLSLGNGETQAE